MIRIEGVSREWAEFSLVDVDLRIEDDEYFVILGPTGAGKTLFLELLAGFYLPDRGRIWRNEEDITGLPPERRGFGFVYQDYMLFPHMTVRENIQYGLRIRKKMDNGLLEEIAEKVGVSYLLHRKPGTLSGGEKQRVAIARALIMRPEVLLLDEPFGSLDSQTSVALRTMVKELHNEYGGIVIHVTHNQEEAVVLGDRVAVMREGRIEQTGRPEEIMRSPRSRFVAEFVGTRNIYHGISTRHGDRLLVNVNGIEIVSARGIEGEVVVTLRPEDIILSRDPIRSSARNEFSGRVSAVIDRGIFCEVSVDIGIPVVAYITRQSLEDLRLKIGEEIEVLFKASAVNLVRD